MKTQQLVLDSLISALGITIYVFGVSLLIMYGENLFGKMDNLLGPIAFLLLFVVSAAITGSLALGRPVMLYLNKKKNEAIKLFLYTIGWLVVFTIVVFIIQIFI
ncbi:hypothetical protein ACFL24_00210 [Patescibacteria group bacterium]